MGRKFLNKLKKDRWMLAAIILISLIGLYLSTGFAMRSTDTPNFCGSCHVMHEPVRTHGESVHGELTCNECHAPKPIVEKIAFKTYAGSKDIYKNLFSDIDDVIHATEKTKQIVNDRCSDCHTMTNLNVEINMDAKEYCTDCHQQVPHSPKKPIDERRVAGE